MFLVSNLLVTKRLLRHLVNNFKILTENDELCSLLMKSGIFGIQLEFEAIRERKIFEKEIQENDILFEFSIFFFKILK